MSLRFPIHVPSVSSQRSTGSDDRHPPPGFVLTVGVTYCDDGTAGVDMYNLIGTIDLDSDLDGAIKTVIESYMETVPGRLDAAFDETPCGRYEYPTDEEYRVLEKYRERSRQCLLALAEQEPGLEGCAVIVLDRGDYDMFFSADESGRTRDRLSGHVDILSDRSQQVHWYEKDGVSKSSTSSAGASEMETSQTESVAS